MESHIEANEEVQKIDIGLSSFGGLGRPCFTFHII